MLTVVIQVTLSVGGGCISNMELFLLSHQIYTSIFIFQILLSFCGFIRESLKRIREIYKTTAYCVSTPPIMVMDYEQPP